VRDYYQNVALIRADSFVLGPRATVGAFVRKFNLYGAHPSG
jgi:hypothetical protein